MAMQARITSKLTRALCPLHLEIVNESYMHNVPKGSETHFRVVVVSDQFRSLPAVRQHQLVYNVLDDELKEGVHALAIKSKTPEQWEKLQRKIDPGQSPNCLGGMKKEAAQKEEAE